MSCMFLRPALLGALLILAGCESRPGATRLSFDESAAIADSLRVLVRGAYDLSKGDVVRGMMSVYPDSGRVVSATGGRTTTSRDSLQMAVTSFWEGVGQYMVRPTWTWGDMHVDVLDRDHAVMTAQYTVPHWTDRGDPHVIGGVWTTVWSRGERGWRVIHEHLSDMPRAMAERLEALLPRNDSLVVPAGEGGHAH